MLSQIPKIAHFYWDGNRMSYLHYLTIVSFHKFNPNWEIIVYHPVTRYTGDNTWKTPEQKIPYHNINYYNLFQELPYIKHISIDFDDYQLPNGIPEIYKSDFIRWELLAKEGGMWSDMDILYIKPLNALQIPVDTELTICKLTYGGQNYHIIGFFLSKANNIFFQNIANKSRANLNLSNYQSMGSTLLNSLYPDDNSIIRTCGNIKFTKLSLDALYSYPPEDNNIINRLPTLFYTNDLSRITDKTIGIHWYNGHNLSKEFNNEFNHFTRSEFNNVLTHFIDTLGDDANIIY